MTRRRITRSVSILVVIAICGGIYALLSSNIARATDPFEQMIDEYSGTVQSRSHTAQ